MITVEIPADKRQRIARVYGVIPPAILLQCTVRKYDDLGDCLGIMARNQRLIVAIGLLMSIFFLYGAFRNLKPQDFIANLQQVNLLLLTVGAVVYFGAVLVITLRWQFLLRAVQFVPTLPLAQLVCIGYMGNNVYPLRAGEALRIFLLRRNHGIPVARSTTVVIVERVFDGLVMLAFIFIGLLFVRLENAEAINTVATIAAPLFLIALLVFFVLAAQPDLLRRLVIFFSRFLPGKLRNIVEKLAEEIIYGLEALRSPVYLAGAVITSFVSWGIEAVVYWLVMFAFGIEQSYPLALLVVGTVNLAGLIPAAPGNVGVYEFFVSTVMNAAGVPVNTGLAYAIVVHIVIWLPVTLAGFFFLAQQGLGWTALGKAHELEASATAG